MKLNTTILILFCLFLIQELHAQMKDAPDWKNYESVLNLKNNQHHYDFDVFCIRSSAPANVFWPGEKAKLTFQLINNTNEAISVDAKVELIQYAAKGIPNDIWLPEMIKVADIQTIPVKVNISANGFADLNLEPEVPETFGGYVLIFDLGKYGRRLATSLVRTFKANPSAIQYPKQALDDIGADFLCGAKELVDVVLTIADVNAAARISNELRRLAHIRQPPDAFLALNGNTRRIDVTLERRCSLKLRARPKFDGDKAKRQTLGRHCKARMHQKSTHGVQREKTIPVLLVWRVGERANFPWLRPFVDEFRGILQKQNGALNLADTVRRGLKMSRENVAFVDIYVRQEAVCGLGICPIRTGHGYRFAHRSIQLRHNLTQTLAQPTVFKRRTGQLAVNP